LGYHYRTSKFSVNDNYDTSYTFFRERARRPKTEVSATCSNSRVGFQIIVRRSGLHKPYVECNGTEYFFEKQNHDGENVFLRVNTPYSFYPFAIQQDLSLGAYLVQLDKKLRHINKYDTTIQALIRIIGEGFEIEKDYVLTSNLLDLRTKRLNPDELIHPENVTFSLEEVKEPSLWRKFLSSFSVTRTHIPK
jgi:hypothetical protein